MRIRPLSFLQDHYNRCRAQGGMHFSHVEYVITNDLSPKVAAELQEGYKRFVSEQEKERREMEAKTGSDTTDVKPLKSEPVPAPEIQTSGSATPCAITRDKPYVLLEWIDNESQRLVRVIAIPNAARGVLPAYADLVAEQQTDGRDARGAIRWGRVDPCSASRLIAVAVYNAAPRT